jgi:hypothetical protein
MSSKRIEIFKKASIHIKKASNYLKISLKCSSFLKKKIRIFKKSLVAIAALPQWPVRPAFEYLYDTKPGTKFAMLITDLTD